MNHDQLKLLLFGLLSTMQLSIIIPMAVVWVRGRQFSRPVRGLSRYVYHSAAMALGGQFYKLLGFMPNNYGFIFGFQFGKFALFGWVYYQVLTSARLQRVMLVMTLFTLCDITGVFLLDNRIMALTVSRVAQCAVLAALAIFYLDQFLNKTTTQPVGQDPIWLLSVGQLIYSAATATAFSLDYLEISLTNHRIIYYLVVSVAGLVFSYFLTLAFLWAKPEAAVLPQAHPYSTKQFAGF